MSKKRKHDQFPEDVVQGLKKEGDAIFGELKIRKVDSDGKEEGNLEKGKKNEKNEKKEKEKKKEKKKKIEKKIEKNNQEEIVGGGKGDNGPKKMWSHAWDHEEGTLEEGLLTTSQYDRLFGIGGYLAELAERDLTFHNVS